MPGGSVYYGPGWQRGLQAPSAVPPAAGRITTPQTSSNPYQPVNTIQGTNALTDIPSMGTGPAAGPALSGGAGSSAPNLTGAPGMTGMGPFGLVPQIPSPTATAGQAIGGNIGNLPALSQLGTGTTQLAAQLGALPYQANLPNYEGMLGQSSQNISSNLAGVIDPAEWTRLTQGMAERGVSMGLGPGSPNSQTALAIALDRDIRAQQAMGQQQLNAAIGRTPTGQPFNIAGQQINPADVQAAQYAANVAGAAPDPTQAAAANLDMLLKSIEAGRAGGLGGVGGVGGGAAPIRAAPVAPGLPYMPVAGGAGAGGPTGTPMAPRPVPTAPGAPPSAPGLVYPMAPQVGTIAEPGTIGQSVFDPYSLGGYSYNPPMEGAANTGELPGGMVEAPGQGSGEGGGVDQMTQDFLDQYGIDWGLPDYGIYDQGGGY